MCFSAQASFTAATALSVIGLATLYKVKDKRMAPLALSPLFFAIQQALEGIVWITVTGTNDTLHTIAVYGFNFFAGIFWPIWIPASLYYAEPNHSRKKILSYLIFVGALVSILSLLSFMFIGIYSTAHNHHINYNLLYTPFSSPTMEYLSAIAWGFYLVATVGAFFTSSINYVWVLGILTALAFVAARALYSTSFGSVWCFFAALISAVTYYITTKKYRKNS